MGRKLGITQNQLSDLSRFENSTHFSDDEKLVLRLAVALSQTPANVSDDLFAALRNRFSEHEMVDLSAAISWENYRSRFNRTFALESEGFSKGEFCPLPESLVMSEVGLKRFDQPDEIRAFDKGKFELFRIGGMTIGRATYAPGWRWSEHVGKGLGQKECMVELVGVVISGTATAAMSDGKEIELHAGEMFYIPPGHDSWVVGNEPYVSLHLLGAADYARHAR